MPPNRRNDSHETEGTDEARTSESRADDPCIVRLGDSRVVAYAEYGDSSGDPVVFLHGTPGCRVSGRLLADAAASLGVRVIAPDRPGYGRSTPQPDRTLAAIGPIVERVLDDAGVDRAGVIGFSGGGPHALALAATRPDRIGRVDVISGAVPAALADERPCTLRALETLATRTPRLLRGVFAVQARFAGRIGPDVVLSQFANDPDAVPDADADVVIRDFQKAFSRYRQGAVTESRLLADDWGLSLSSVDLPTNFWHGKRDENVPQAGVRRLTERLPEATLTVADADHLGTLLRTRTRVLESHRTFGEG